MTPFSSTPAFGNPFAGTSLLIPPVFSNGFGVSGVSFSSLGIQVQNIAQAIMDVGAQMGGAATTLAVKTAGQVAQNLSGTKGGNPAAANPRNTGTGGNTPPKSKGFLLPPEFDLKAGIEGVFTKAASDFGSLFSNFDGSFKNLFKDFKGFFKGF